MWGVQIFNMAPNTFKKSKPSNPPYILDQSSRKSRQKFFLNSVIIFLLLCLLALIFFFINWLTNYDKTATLDFFIAPSTATIKLNNQSLKSDGKIKLKPGNYLVTIENSNFSGFSKEIELKTNQTTFLYEYLEPDQNHQDYYQTHPEETSRIQHISDFKADLERKNYTDSDPIFKVTPFSSYQSGFSINAEKQKQTSKVLLKIDLFTCSDQQLDSLKSAAYQYLKDNQINPDNYDIEFTNC